MDIPGYRFIPSDHPNAKPKQLCEDLDKIKEWAFQWKMSFNPDPSKQAQEVIFTRKVKKVVHPPIFFNNKPVQQVSLQNNLGLLLDISLMNTVKQSHLNLVNP